MIRTTFSSLITLTRDDLAKFLGLDPSRVKLWARKSLPPAWIKADIFVALRPGLGRSDPSWSDPMGRQGTKVDRIIWVDLFTRLAVDEVVATDKWLLGHLAVEDRVVDWCQIYQPTGALAPYHFDQVTDEQQFESVPGWGTSSLSFIVQFIQDLNQGRQ